MFACHVLVGDSAKGDSSMVRPPPKNPAQPHENLYNSCVNNTNNPSIFVVFEMQQAYPSYIITYQ